MSIERGFVNPVRRSRADRPLTWKAPRCLSFSTLTPLAHAFRVAGAALHNMMRAVASFGKYVAHHGAAGGGRLRPHRSRNSCEVSSHFRRASSSRTTALKSLGHWVGDIHQPLHVSFDDDRGGNLVAIMGVCWRNLHAAWDSCLVEKTIGPDYERAAAQLRSEITAEDRARWTPAEIGPESVTAWANESFVIATSPGVGYCVQKDGACWYSADQREYHGGDKRVVDIDDGYLAAQGPIVRERLKAAAIRLAAILNVALTPGF
jgi:hypothetical protein